MSQDTLTVGQAVAAMRAPIEGAATLVSERPVEEEQEATLEAEAEAKPETAEEEASEEADPEAEAEPDAEALETEVIEPPKRWDAEDKARFATLAVEVQALLIKQEDKREAVLTKDRDKARAEAQQEIAGEREGVVKISNAFKEYLPRILAQRQAWFGEKFDLAANIAQFGADKALIMKDEWEADQEQVETLVRAAKVAEDQDRLDYQRRQYARLTELRPEFADPSTGKAQREAFAKAMLEVGATGDELEMIPAWGVDLALDGLKYRKDLAAAKVKAKPDQKPAPKPVKPTAPEVRTTQQRSLEQHNARLDKSGSVEDAMAVLRARRKG